MSVPLKKYWVLQRDFMAAKPAEQFRLDTIEAQNGEAAWEKIEEEFATSNPQEWLLTKKELEALKLVLGGGK